MPPTAKLAAKRRRENCEFDEDEVRAIFVLPKRNSGLRLQALNRQKLLQERAAHGIARALDTVQTCVINRSLRADVISQSQRESSSARQFSFWSPTKHQVVIV